MVIKAYHRWGAGCVDRFRGMFAFALAERDSGRLVLCRDRLGIKPLYLCESPGRLRFASTLPALLAAGDVDTDLDTVALHHYMTFHSVVPAPRTILAGVRKLPPATIRTVEPDGSSTEEVYWRPVHSRDAARDALSEPEWQELVLDTLRTAVQRRMVGDVPVGVLLSGGIDSSLVVALLAESGQSGLNTFSIGFEAVAGTAGDEFHYSDVVAKEYDTEHHQLLIPTADVLDGLPGAIAAMSEPMVSHDCVAFYLLSREVSRHVRVVQSGQGADEVLAGYDWYPPLADVPAQDALTTYSASFFDRPDDVLTGLLRPHWRAGGDPSRAFVADHFDAPGADGALDRALRLDSTVMLVDDPVKRVDNMTMAWGLEARVPFLDHEFVELVATVPPAAEAGAGRQGGAEGGLPRRPARIGDRPAEGVLPGAGDHQPGGGLPGPGAGRAELAGGPGPRPVRAGLPEPAARRAEHAPHHARLQPAVAGRPAGDVAAGARCLSRSPSRPGSPGSPAPGGRRCPLTARRWRTSATAPGCPGC